MKDHELQELLSRMTLEEKAGQLVQLDGACFGTRGITTGPQEALGITQETVDMAGSTLNVLGADTVRRIQENYLKRSRLGIPLLFMADIIYGYKTIFPIPLGLGCTWNPELIGRDYAFIGRESAADGAMVTFAPMLDLVRDARWGRCMESTGEDPLLNSRYGEAMVKGLQGDMVPGKNIASCIKHYAAYGAVEAGREYNTVDMSEMRLRQDYLPAYKAGVDAGCRMVMSSFNVLNGIPATANKHLMVDILRDEWGFDGTVITDFASIYELIMHGVAADEKEAALMAFRAQTDVDMQTGCYANNLADLVREGKIAEADLDRACMRGLKLKNELGLFEDPYYQADALKAQEIINDPAGKEAAVQTALEACVLLKNNGVLPLAKTGVRTALIGPYADTGDMLGLWAIHADRSHSVTLRQAFEQKLSPENFRCCTGCKTLDDPAELGDFGNIPVVPKNPDEETVRQWEKEAIEAAEWADVIVLAMGEHTLQTGEGGSRTDITLPAPQKELIRKLAAYHKPMVLVLFNGRPMALSDVEPYTDALLEAWFPGIYGALAVTDLLFGDANPSGRLSVSMPYTTGQVPVYYSHGRTGRPCAPGQRSRFTSRYLDAPNEPLYPFGYGLGYHKAVYGETKPDKTCMKSGETLTVSVTVRNDGDREGCETVQLYLHDCAAAVARPVKELKDFRRIVLKPGEEKTVQFTIDEEMLKYVHADCSYAAEAGTFEVMTGPDSERLSCAVFKYIQ